MERAWILIGMMGSGKTTIGRELARLSGREFVDLDAVMQRRLGRTVRSLFKVYGEETFRDHETQALRSLQPGNFVLATGGGVVLREQNWIEMRRLGITVFLDVAWEQLVVRLGRGRQRRPLLQTEDWEQRARELYEARRPLYLQADVIVPLNDQLVTPAARRVLEELERW
jgi:shikimate kinase